MRHSEAGKGSRARDVDKEKYESNYDTIFGKKKTPVTEQDSTMISPACKTDPRASHGFCRNASHNAGRYVCECEFWEPEEK